MFISYHRVGKSAVLPALAAVGLLVMVGGIAAIVAVTTLAIAGVVAFGLTVLRAVGLGGTRRRLAFYDDKTLEGIVVNRSSSDSEPSITESQGPTAGQRGARAKSTKKQDCYESDDGISQPRV